MLQGKQDEIDCQNLIVIIKDSTDRQFLTKNNIVTMLKNAQLYPVNKPIHSINTHIIEEKIAEVDKDGLFNCTRKYRSSRCKN